MNRRSLLIGIGAALSAPAIVKAESLMKVAALRESLLIPDWVPCDGRLLRRADYPDLYGAIGTSYGGDNQFFRIPDTRKTVVRLAMSAKKINGFPAGAIRVDLVRGAWPA